jgi:hypothetical protein
LFDEQPVLHYVEGSARVRGLSLCALRHNRCEMKRDLHSRWWRFAAALALLFALMLLLVPQVQHGHASLLLATLAPILWIFSIVVLQQQHALLDEQIFPLDPLLRLPSLSHLPPPSPLA